MYNLQLPYQYDGSHGQDGHHGREYGHHGQDGHHGRHGQHGQHGHQGRDPIRLRNSEFTQNLSFFSLYSRLSESFGEMGQIDQI